MKLNLDIIFDHLPDTFQKKRLGKSVDSLHLLRPLLCDTSTFIQNGSLYILRAEILNQMSVQKNASFIVLGKYIKQEWILNHVDLLLIEEPQDFLTVFNEISKIYDTFDNWEIDLRNELEKDIDFDIKNVLVLGAKMLKNAIMVTDHTLQLILQANYQFDSKNSEQTSITVTDTRTPMDLQLCSQLKNVYLTERNITKPYLSSFEQSNVRSYCNNLYPQEHFAGCIAVSEMDHPFLKGDFSLMDYYFSYFQKAFFKYLQSFNPLESSTIQALFHLLNQEPLSPEESSCFTLKEGEHWACFKLKELPNSRYMPKEYMYATLNTLLPQKAYSVIYRGEIVGLLKLAKSPEETITLFQELLHRMNYTAGLSNKFTDLTHVSLYFLQASYASQNNRQDSLLYSFSQCILPYVLYECTNNMPASLLCTDGLTAIMEYDQKRNTDYLHTLDVYLQHEMSITKTSEKLFIHRSSLMKRLNKIKQLLPETESLDDPNTRLYYRFFFALSKQNK